VKAARSASFGCLALAPADAQSPKKESATGGAWRFRAYQEQQGFGGTTLRRSGTALLVLRTPAQLDEFRGDALLSVSRKTALYSTAGPPRHGDARAIRPTVDRLTPVERATREQVPPHGCWNLNTLCAEDRHVDMRRTRPGHGDSGSPD
jgi:hypothetical protein